MPRFPAFCALRAPHRFTSQLAGHAKWFGELAAQHSCCYCGYLTGVTAAVINECVDPTWAPPSGPGPRLLMIQSRFESEEEGGESSVQLNIVVAGERFDAVGLITRTSCLGVPAQ